MGLGVGRYPPAACGQTVERVGGYARGSETLPVHTYPPGERNPVVMKKEKGDLDRQSKETMKLLDLLAKSEIAEQKTPTHGSGKPWS